MAHEQSGPGTQVKVELAFSNVDFQSPRAAWAWPLQCSHLPAAKTLAESPGRPCSAQPASCKSFFVNPLMVASNSSFAAFKILSFSLGFRNLTKVCLGGEIFEFILLRVCQASWMSSFYTPSSVSSGKFLTSVPSNTFSAPFCLVSMWDSCGSFHCVLPALSNCLLCSSCSSDWIISHLLILRSSCSNLLLDPSSGLFISLLHFSALEFI